MTKNEDSPFQTLRSEDEIKQIFKENKVDLSRPMTATCGAGMYILYRKYSKIWIPKP